MSKFRVLYLFLLCLFFSCKSEVDENIVRDIDCSVRDVDYGVPYEDTSTFIRDYTNKTNSTIQIGSQQFITTRYHIFPKDDNLQPFFNWPMVTYTNKGTVLVVCTNSQFFGGDGIMDVIMARREKESDNWEIKRLYQTDGIKGQAICPALVIDRNTGRIYLFANHVKKADATDDLFYDDADQVYKYSDDDGITWSKEYSLKQTWRAFYNTSSEVFSLFGNKTDDYSSLWYVKSNSWSGNKFNTNSNLACISCGPNGISMKNGTLLLTSAVIVNGIWHSVLLIRENGFWRYSSPTPHSGDTESTVYIDNENHIVVDCRTLTTDRRKYYYNFEKDEFVEKNPSVIGSYVRVHTEVVNDNGLFYMCYPDSQDDTRKNITFYGSKDGINWKKLFLFYPMAPTTYGYTSIASKDNSLLVCWESPDGIYVQDLSVCRDAIRNEILNN